MSHHIFAPQHFGFSIRAWAASLVLFFMFACQEDPEEVIKPENRLNAQAGPDQTVLIETQVILDASASNDENGSTFSYSWSFKTKPSGSMSSIIGSTSREASFTPDKVGVYTIALTISHGNFSDIDELHVVATKTDSPDEPQTIFIENDIEEELVLEDIFTESSLPDYIVTGDIRVLAALYVEPGVVIEFEQDKSLQMMLGGALVAEGTQSRPITFTGVEKRHGYWKGLMFATNSDLNKLQHTIIEFGGSSELPESPRSNIAVPGDAISGSTLQISNSIIRYSGGTGLYVGGMSYLSEFAEMGFMENGGSAIYCSPRNVSRIDPQTVFSGNGFDGVETGGILNENGVASWYPLINGTFRLNSDLTISSELEIGSGAVIKMAKNVLITVLSEGSLMANGSADAKIVFEGTSSIAENAWKGILFSSWQDNVMNYTIVRNAGYSEMPGLSNTRTNIGIATGARLTIKNSLLEKSAGWGIAVEQGAYYNEDIHIANNFIAMSEGSVKFPEQPQPVNIAGEWVEYFSFHAKNFTIDEDFYNRQTGQWFDGAATPWEMAPATGFGLKVDESGNYTWIIATQHSPGTECFSYSAEHFTGQVTADGEFLNFVEASWRSKYFNSCTPEENVDMEVAPGSMSLPYKVNKEYNVVTGEEYWVLTITSGGETFNLYKK